MIKGNKKGQIILASDGWHFGKKYFSIRCFAEYENNYLSDIAIVSIKEFGSNNEINMQFKLNELLQLANGFLEIDKLFQNGYKQKRKGFFKNTNPNGNNPSTLKELNLTFAYNEESKQTTCYINLADSNNKINCGLNKYEFKAMNEAIINLYRESKAAFYSIQREFLNTIPILGNVNA